MCIKISSDIDKSIKQKKKSNDQDYAVEINSLSEKSARARLCYSVSISHLVKYFVDSKNKIMVGVTVEEGIYHSSNE